MMRHARFAGTFRGVGLGLAFAAGVAACGGDHEGTPPTTCRAADGGVLVGHGPADDYFLPDQTLSDWVSYSDQIAVVSVVGEVARAPEGTPGGGEMRYIPRDVTLRVEQTLWPQGDVAASRADVTFTWWGWSARTAQAPMVPVLHCYVPRLSPGGRYVAALSRFAGGVVAPLTGGAILAAPGDPIAAKDIATHGYGEVAHALSTSTLEEMSQIFGSTPLDPFAAKHLDLPPVERFQAASVERNAAQRP